ncbi:actin-like ATPase domain-containing protein [Dacryopinax primogenitus]|uniref:Actin-like ATPase domain-containing protein n=1 Tax=Dacryopinax primogenitus (strain DJM 731) TaxID=1858805 RepID=M5G4I9_DACPD|nr:actin-like ATPase domain-containing protein [Dacryopinax primogenitus]EJU03609.1 actin-like ATPase domain-containing protein [Dacryopinax primogenitus]
MSFRDASIVVIDCSQYTLTAGRGLADLLALPSIHRSTLSPDDPDPFHKSGDVLSWPSASAIWKRLLFTDLGVRRRVNESPVCLSFPAASYDTYERLTQLFFEKFNVPALCVVQRPLAQLFAVNVTTGLVVDVGVEETICTPVVDTVLQHTGVFRTPVGRKDCEVYLAHLLSSSQSITQSLSPPESPLSPSTLWNQLLALVRQLVRDGQVRAPSEDGEEEDEGLTDVAAALVAGKEREVVEAATRRKANDKRTHAAADRVMETREREIAALDLVTVEFEGKTVRLGKERHRFCEPLFDPSVLRSTGLREKAGWTEQELEEKVLSVQEAAQEGMMKLEWEKRKLVWEGVLVTGEMGNVKGLPSSLHSHLQPYIHAEDDSPNPPPPSRILKIPEYFAEYRDKGEGLAGFLGACIVAKVAFADPSGKNYVSKLDYNAKGPISVLSNSPSLF